MSFRHFAAVLKTEAAAEPTSLPDTLSRTKLLLQSDRLKLTVLDCGSCEALKLGVHATTLGLAVLMGAYNAAAWLRRREQHLAFNAVLYAALIALEREHVTHHLAALRHPRGEVQPESHSPAA
jgi:hypothetical protein